jgi:hypothetical protein
MLSMATLNFFQVHLYFAPCTFVMTCFNSSKLEVEPVSSLCMDIYLHFHSPRSSLGAHEVLGNLVPVLFWYPPFFTSLLYLVEPLSDGEVLGATVEGRPIFPLLEDGFEVEFFDFESVQHCVMVEVCRSGGRGVR